MPSPRLSDFIRDNIDTILQEWEDFARTIEPPALTMDDESLRDHAYQMLHTIADDLDTAQSDHERDEKSKGNGRRDGAETPAEIHAEARLLSGYTVVQLVSEYRALRTSVLALWDDESAGRHTDMGDMRRFNEAIDQALAESVARYERLVKQSQHMFLAILGHDLRNPLGTLATGSSFIMAAADVPPTYVRVANRMQNSATRMGKLVDDLIDFSRTHLGPGIPLRVKQADLAAVCEQAVAEMRTFHPERQVELNAPSRLEAVFDDSRIAQVLSNLIGNAIQYGGAETPVRVDVDGDRADDIVIAINNRGPVIPPDQIAKIFDPLVRAASSVGADVNEHSSLGLGLFVSREIVVAHGGHIAVTSGQDDGTTFTVSLPRKP